MQSHAATSLPAAVGEVQFAVFKANVRDGTAYSCTGANPMALEYVPAAPSDGTLSAVNVAETWLTPASTSSCVTT